MPLDNPKSEFSEWYDEVLLRAEIVDKRTPVKGANVLMSNGHDIWEMIKFHLSKHLRRTGHKFGYFPMFIPDYFLEREAEHFSGFTPEVAWVTHSGDTELSTKLALRPTSETIMYHSFAKWIHSHADLPLKYSQWCNIIRWDTSETRPLLRDREFLWNEAHTVHQSREEAEAQIDQSIEIYQALFDKLAVSSLVVKRPEYDKFAGAEYTIAYDMPMPDGKVLQIATTHMLSDHFSKVFDVTYLSAEGETEYAYQTSYGLTTRLIAAIIAMHGDDQGLVIPPEVAPVQLVIIPILFERRKDDVLEKANKILDHLERQGLSVVLDDRDQYTPGWKFSEWEMRGVPVRLELGPRDLDNDQVVLVRRDTGEKLITSIESVSDTISQLLTKIQLNLKQRAEQTLDEMIVDVSSLDQIEEIHSQHKRIYRSYWCEEESCRNTVKDRFSLEIRGNIYDSEEHQTGSCIVCDKSSSLEVYLAQAH